jgi:hypothetical protein
LIARIELARVVGSLHPADLGIELQESALP